MQTYQHKNFSIRQHEAVRETLVSTDLSTHETRVAIRRMYEEGRIDLSSYLTGRISYDIHTALQEDPGKNMMDVVSLALNIMLPDNIRMTQAASIQTGMLTIMAILQSLKIELNEYLRPQNPVAVVNCETCKQRISGVTCFMCLEGHHFCGECKEAKCKICSKDVYEKISE